LSKPSTLSARSNEQPAYQGTDLQEALNLADQYEKQDEQEREAAYQESLGKGRARYEQENLPANTEDNYNAVAEELSAKAEEANKTREGLAENFKRATQERKDIDKELDRLEDEIDAAESKGDQNKLDALREEQEAVPLSAKAVYLASLTKHKQRYKRMARCSLSY